MSLVAFAVVAAVHLGFQATVTLLVYPVLSRVPAEQWAEAHARHSRLIAPVVVVVYAALVAAGAWALAVGPSAAVVVAGSAAAACIGVTAAAAAPTHARLDRPDPALLRRLLRADRVRGVLAVWCLGAALVALG